MYKKDLWSKMVILTIFILLISSSLSAAQMGSEQKAAVSENNFEIEYTMRFSEDDLIFNTFMGFDIVQLMDSTSVNVVGKPMMPAKEIQIALPAGMAVEDIRVVDFETVDITGEYNIFPAQPPRQTDGSDVDVEFVKADIDTYKSNQQYPSKLVEFVDQTDLAGQSIAGIQITPLQYIPSEKKLILYKSITFEIEGVDGYVCSDYLSPMISEQGRKTYEKIIESMVINPENVELNTDPEGNPAPLSLPPGGPYDYVIIGYSAHELYWQPLIDWRTKQGLKATFVSTSYIYSNYAGSDNQEKIRNFVIDAHNSWGTYYFLIAGENNQVPFEFRTYEGDSIPSDQYYGDYDDDWDYEVYVGRATASTSTEVDTFIDKVLMYEKTPPLTNYVLDAALLGMDLTTIASHGQLTRGEYLKEYIDSNYIPSRFVVTEVYDTDPSNHRTDFLNALNDGQNLVNHNDHSNYNVMGTGYLNHGWSIYNSDVDSLTNNNRLSVIYSLGCWPNAMDYSDCIAEHFVIHNPLQAGVAFTGNTRSGWFYIGDPYSLSCDLDRDWWRGLFYYDNDNDKYILGETLAYTKNINSYTGIWAYCQWTLNLLGDPAMPIWTDTPLSLDVTHPDTLPIGSSVFDVHVESGGAPVENAYICLWKGDEVYLRGYSDVNGDVSFNPSPSTVGTLYVTVTKHNYLPDEGIATVVGGGNQPPYVPSNPLPSDGAAGVNIDVDLSWDGGDPDSGDIVYYDVYFGTNPSPPFTERIGPYPATQTTITYDPGTLSYNTQYYWKINAEDNFSAGSEGPVWDFTTVELNQPPYTPSDPDPFDSADANVNTDLSWDGGDPNTGDTVYYEVYLGTTSVPGYYDTTPTYPATQTRITYDPGSLDINTHYYWQIVAWDNHGVSSPGPIWEFTTTALPSEQFNATQDIPVQNNGISGSYIDTHDSDDIYEGITERKVGPRSRLEHKWTIDVTGGHTLYIFYLEAYHTGNSEGDDFVFSYSTDDSIYTEMMTVSKTSDDDSYQTYFLPILSGTVYIKVEDTDRTKGHTALDTIYIDHMYIEASSPPNRPPAKPTNPTPENGASNVDINPTLSVTVSDPDGNNMDVTFYNAYDNSTIGSIVYDVPNGDTASVIWDNLAYETNYSWYAIADDGEYTNTSDTWSFTTRGESQPGGMYVWDISWRTKNAGKNTFLYHTITVRWDSDGDGIAEETDEIVSEATVYSHLTQNETTNSWDFSGNTDTSGQVEFGTKVTSGDFTVEVTNIVHSTYIYTPELDVDNPDYYSI